MRLYLSSFDLGHQTSELTALAPKGRVGLVMNALDNRLEARSNWQGRQSTQLEALGFSVGELDLRRFFGARDALQEALADLDMLWINGGNSFILRRAMRLSGFDDVIKVLLSRDALAYAGFSAAAVVTAPSLRGLEAVDDPEDVPEGYPTEIIWEGLGLLPFAVVVHYRSDHPESAAVENEVALYEREGIPYRTLRDGQALVVQGSIDRLKIVG